MNSDAENAKRTSSVSFLEATRLYPALTVMGRMWRGSCRPAVSRPVGSVPLIPPPSHPAQAVPPVPGGIAAPATEIISPPN